MFAEGDNIAHTHHGLGTIVGVEEKEILGTRSVMATVRFERQEMEMTLALERLHEQARPVLGREDAEEILHYLADLEKDLSSEWKLRQRNNQARLTSGDPYELCDVIKGLGRLKRQRGGLPMSDQEQLEKAVRLLSEELALALRHESSERVQLELRRCACC